MSSLTFYDYLTEIKKSNINPVIRLEWLNPDLSVNHVIESDMLNASGSISISFDQFGERRSASITLYNVDKKYNANINKVWFAQPIRLSTGVYINNTPYYIKQGVFYVTNPEQMSNPAEKTTTLQLVDKRSMLDGTLFGTLGYVYQVPVNSNIYDAIRTLLVSDRGNGYKVDPVTPNFTSYYVGKTTVMPDGISFERLLTPYTLREERSKTLWDVVSDLCYMLGALVYYNQDGQLTIEPSQTDVSDSSKGSVWDFTTEEFEYLGSNVEHKFTDMYNTVLVVGDTINGMTASSKVSNNNLTSSTCVQRIGEKLMLIEDSSIYSDLLAEERAKYELKRTTMVQKSISINSIPLYHLSTNQVITLTDDSLDFNKERFLIQSISLPLDIGGQMQISATSVNELNFD